MLLPWPSYFFLFFFLLTLGLGLKGLTKAHSERKKALLKHPMRRRRLSQRGLIKTL